MTFTVPNPPTDAELDTCIRCGLCLPHCPTYRVTGLETESPRGRIFLIRELAQDRRVITKNFRAHIDLCLGCQNCETACPSGVRFGRLIQAARDEIVAEKKASSRERLVRWLVLQQIFPHPSRLAFLFRLLALYQRLGLQRLVRAMQILRLTDRLRNLESLLPAKQLKTFQPPASTRNVTEVKNSAPTIALFTGCVMRAGYSSIHEATINVVERNGMRVVIPDLQTCCGALHAHAGESNGARELARKNIEAYEREKWEFIAVNAAGCGALLKEYGHLLGDDPRYAGRAQEFASRVRDISELVAAHPLAQPMRQMKVRVTYQEPCHLAHAQRIKAQPRAILNQIPGVEFVEMQASDRCCGSAGIYNVVHPKMAETLLAEKMQNTIATKADLVVTGNIGCLMQMGYGARKFGYDGRVMHWIELLNEAYTT